MGLSISFLASQSSLVYWFHIVFKNMVVYLLLLFGSVPLLLLSWLCFSWISISPILLNVAFIPSSFSKLWDLVLEKSPGMSILRVHTLLVAPAPLVFLSVGPCPHFLLEWATPCSFNWCSQLKLPWSIQTRGRRKRERSTSWLLLVFNWEALSHMATPRCQRVWEVRFQLSWLYSKRRQLRKAWNDIELDNLEYMLQ